MNLKWLEKAVMTTDDINPAAVGTAGGILSPQQTAAFIRVAITASTFLQDVNVFTSRSPKFEVPRISFANRILRVGTEAERLASGDRTKPATGLVTLSTNLFKGEIPISDETFEDNIELDGLADTIATMIAEAVGRDLEEILIKSDTARDPGGNDPAADVVFDQTDGAIKLLQAGLPGGQKLNMTGVTSYTDMFAAMIAALPPRYRRNYSQMRIYVPTKHRDGYSQELSERGTPLGDTNVVQGGPSVQLAYRGIPVVEVPLMDGTSTVNGAAIDYSKFAMLIHPLNYYLGWHRRIRMERYRDPREGATSFIPSLRVDAKFADPDYGVLAFNVDL